MIVNIGLKSLVRDYFVYIYYLLFFEIDRDNGYCYFLYKRNFELNDDSVMFFKNFQVDEIQYVFYNSGKLCF